MTKTKLKSVTMPKHKIKILALLNRGGFLSITKIHGKMGVSVNRERLRKTLEEMKDDEIVEGLPRDDKGYFNKDEIKKLVKEGRTELEDLDKRAGEYYKITPRGQDKFTKILTLCLKDPYLRKYIFAVPDTSI